jgi:hypothetical protein
MCSCLGDSKVRKYLAQDPNLSPRVDHVRGVFRAYEQATTSTTVQGSWQKADFDFITRSGTQYLWVDEAKIRGSPHVLELWAIDYPEESLSQRRRQEKLGWLNRDHCANNFTTSLSNRFRKTKIAIFYVRRDESRRNQCVSQR